MICDSGDVTKYEKEKSSVDKGDENKTTHSQYYKEKKEKEKLEKETPEIPEAQENTYTTSSEPCVEEQTEEPCNCENEGENEWEGNTTFGSSIKKITKG